MRNLKIILAILLLLLVSACSSNSGEGQENTTTANAESGQDTEEVSTNQEVEQDENVRIVATTFAITQIMDKLELDLIGIPTTSYSVPERYQEVTEVGNPMSPDMELVSSLKPTDVLSVTTLRYDLEPQFEQAGVETSFLNLQSVTGMNDAIMSLGTKYNRLDQANTLIGTIEDKIAEIEIEIEIETETKDEISPKVLILLGVPGSYLVATEHSYVGDLVNVAGGENAITGHNEEYISANMEYLQQANPDVILRLSHGMPDEVVEMFNEEFVTNDIWKHFNAVKTDRVYDLKEPVFATTANIQVIEALDELAAILYE
ncbi:heme ABC transporter substrate-binding protein IsdE [Paraliobacillus sediminis]|uniref:heme ABC transporter substrate-binding protein IsdE n=1 Tax=Paraliobacillus sediminis TaxID=1885916 RepID=UPI001F0834A1|nr:heme ABC transporter substrate-binding protein IsdE [Paraliobacillus sediminis]